MAGSVTRRRFIALGLGVLSGLAGCTVTARSCGPGPDTIHRIRQENRLTDVQLQGTVMGTYEETESGRQWFNLDDTSGTALVIPTDARVDDIAALERDQCVTVTGHVTEIYEGQYTTCVDPGDSTCSFLTTDIKLTDADWTIPG